MENEREIYNLGNGAKAKGHHVKAEKPTFCKKNSKFCFYRNLNLKVMKFY